MKKIVLFLAISLLTAQQLFAQEVKPAGPASPPKHVAVKAASDGDVPPNDMILGVAKGISQGMAEILTSITAEAGKMSETNLGKTAISILYWKTIGKEITKLILGFVLIALEILVFSHITKLLFTNRSFKGTDADGKDMTIHIESPAVKMQGGECAIFLCILYSLLAISIIWTAGWMMS